MRNVTPGLARAAYAAAVVAALLAGLVLRQSVIWAGFFADDFDHHAMQQGDYPVPRARFDLFNFSDGTLEENRLLMQSGHFPWWSDPRVHLSMWRPLPSALIAFDFAAFGLDARWFHAHSLLWWLALVLAVALLLRHSVPPGVAALAVMFFVLEEGHRLPVGWLANRSTLVATTFAVLALHAHLRGRPRVAYATVALALASGEYTFAVLAYFVAFAVVMDDAPWGRRVRALLPFAALAIVYLAVRSALGYGIDRSGFYISPSADPLAFIVAAAWRIPVLLGDLVFGVPADWYLAGTPWREALLRAQWFTPAQWYALPDWRTWQILIGVVALGVVLRLAWRAPRPVRAFAAGAVLSLLPMAGSMVSGRLTVAASLGIDVLLAWLVLALFARARGAAAALSGLVVSAGCVALAVVVLYVHGLRAAELAERGAQFQGWHSELERRWVLESELDDARVSDQIVLVVAAQDLTTTAYLPYVRRAFGLRAPRAVWLLSGAQQPHDFERVADNALELSVLTNQVELMAVGSNYRPADAPFRPGDAVRLQGFTATVVSVLRGQPQRVRFELERSLDDPQYVFLSPGPRGLRRFPLPRSGERLRFPRPMYPTPEALQAQALDLRRETPDHPR